MISPTLLFDMKMHPLQGNKLSYIFYYFLYLEFKCSCFRVDVDIRQGSVKLQLKGIFVGAKVVRGPDWDWGNQVRRNIPRLAYYNQLNLAITIRMVVKEKLAEW